MTKASDSSIASGRWSRSQWTYGAILIGLVLVIAVPFLLKPHSEWDDVFIAAANRLMAGEDLYYRGSNFTYPPMMSAVAVPFALAGVTVGRWLWLAVTLAALAIMWLGAWWLSGGRGHLLMRSTPMVEQVICWLGIACSLRFCLNNVSHHQSDILIGALMMAGALMLVRGRSMPAGVMLGLAAAIKGPALLWLGYLIYRRDGKGTLAMVLTGLLVSLLPDAVSPAPEGRFWLHHWYETRVADLGSANHYPGVWHSEPDLNQSLAGLLYRYLVCGWEFNGERYVTVPRAQPAWSPSQLRSLLSGVELALVAAAGAAMLIGPRWKDTTSTSHRPSALAWEASLVVLFIVLFSPMSSKPHFVTLVLPGMCLARQWLKGGDRFAGAALVSGILFLNVGWNVFGDWAEFAALWFGTITLGTLALLVGVIHARTWQTINGDQLDQPVEPIRWPEADRARRAA